MFVMQNAEKEIKKKQENEAKFTKFCWGYTQMLFKGSIPRKKGPAHLTPITYIDQHLECAAAPKCWSKYQLLNKCLPNQILENYQI